MANEHKYTAGEIATFKGYTSLGEGMEPILAQGQRVVVDHLGDDDTIVVVAVNDAGERLAEDGNLPTSADAVLMADSLWASELLPILTEEVLVSADEAPVELDGIDRMTPDFVSALSKPKMVEHMQEYNLVKPTGWSGMPVAKAREAFLASVADRREAAPLPEAAEEAPVAAAEGAPTPAVEEAPTPEVEEAIADAAPEEQTNNPNTKVVLDPTLKNTDTAAVRDALLQGKNAVVVALDLFKRAQRIEFTLGGVLKRVSDTNAHHAVGYTGNKGFAQFCEDYIGIDYRKARYLVAIYTKFTSIGLDEEHLERIGWTKAKELARISDDELAANIDQLLDYAGNHTCDELTAMVRSNYEVATRGDAVPMTKFTFAFGEGDAAVINDALDRAIKQNSEVGDANQALLAIAMEWMNEGNGADLSLDDFVALGVGRFGKEEVMAAMVASDEATDEESLLPEENAEEVA